MVQQRCYEDTSNKHSRNENTLNDALTNSKEL